MTKNTSFREIDNGYLICESDEGPSGYSYKETYVKDKPEIVVKSSSAPKNNPLKAAINKMNQSRG